MAGPTFNPNGGASIPTSTALTSSKQSDKSETSPVVNTVIMASRYQDNAAFGSPSQHSKSVLPRFDARTVRNVAYPVGLIGMLSVLVTGFKSPVAWAVAFGGLIVASVADTISG